MPSIFRSGRCFLAVAFAAALAACSGPEPTHVTKTVDPPAGDWLVKSPMPTPRFFAGSAVANGLLYVVGGRNYNSAPDNSTAAVALEAYDPASDSWTRLAPMPTPREMVGVGSVNGIVYAVGGNGVFGAMPVCCTLDRVEAYDPSTGAWTTRAALPVPRYYVGVGAVNGILYAVGGLGEARIEPRVDAYDPSTDSWTTVAPMSRGRTGIGVAVVNGIIYVIGGASKDSSGTGHFEQLVEAYDPATNTWTTRSPMPTARFGLALGVVNGVIYAVGGMGADYAYVTTVEAYDPATDTWTSKPPLSVPRYFLNAAGIGGHLFAVGGGTTDLTNGNDTPYGLLEEYTP